MRLVPSVAVLESPDESLLNLGDRLLRVRGAQPELRQVLRLLGAGSTAEQLAAAWNGDAVAALLGELEACGWLSSEPHRAFPGETYERQVDYLSLFTPDTAAAQQRLLDARVAVIGVGGIGGIVAQHLVAAGVGRFTLVDHDTVAAHNLNRQFTYGPQDVGRPKVRALARYLRSVRPDAQVTEVGRRVTSVADLAAALPAGLDLVVVAADSPADLPATVWTWAAATGTAMAVGSVGVGTGFWGPVLDPSRGGCWTCFERARLAPCTDLERELEQRSTEPARFSFGPSNTATAAMLAHDIVQFVCSGSCPTMGRRAALDFTRQRITHSEESTCTCPTSS